MMPPWELPSKYTSLLSSTADPSGRMNSGSITSPLSASIRRPSTSWLIKPWLIRSTNVGKFEKSCSADTAVGMSSSLNPAHFVAQ